MRIETGLHDDCKTAAKIVAVQLALAMPLSLIKSIYREDPEAYGYLVSAGVVLLLILLFLFVLSSANWYEGYKNSEKTEDLYHFSILFWLLNIATSLDFLGFGMLTPLILIYMVHRNLLLEAKKRSSLEGAKVDVAHKLIFAYLPVELLARYFLKTDADSCITYILSAGGWIIYFAGWAGIIFRGRTKPIRPEAVQIFVFLQAIFSIFRGYFVFVGFMIAACALLLCIELYRRVRAPKVPGTVATV